MERQHAQWVAEYEANEYQFDQQPTGETDMPKIGEMIESKFMKKDDIHGEAIMTIAKVGQVNVAQENQPEELKWAVKFAEHKKPMVLNSTNIQLLGAICGDDTDDWTGKKVCVYIDPSISFQGKLTGGLRIKAATPKPANPEAGMKSAGTETGRIDDLEDDIPF